MHKYRIKDYALSCTLKTSCWTRYRSIIKLTAPVSVARALGIAGTYPTAGGSGSTGSQKTWAIGIMTWYWGRLGALQVVGVCCFRIRVPNCH